MKKIAFCSVLVGIGMLCGPAAAQAMFLTPDQLPVTTAPTVPYDDPTTGQLKVITRVVPPFVVDVSNDPNHLCSKRTDGTIPAIAEGANGKKFCGYSQELLQELAKRMNREVAPQALALTAKDIINQMSGDRPGYDLAVGNLSITSERLSKVDFSTPIPILNSGIQIMTRAPEKQRPHILHNIWAMLTSTGAKQFYPILGLIFLLMVATALVVYIIERGRTGSFLEGQPWVGGTAEAFWWILTTIFGQEEAHPRRLASRIIAFMWIPFGVICVALFTASMTASLTAQQIQNTVQNVGDLQDKTVLTVQGSTSLDYLVEQGIHPKLVSTINDAYPQLINGKVDAIVYDAPVLQYFADHDKEKRVVTVGKLLKRESYGIVLGKNSPLTNELNTKLLEMQEQGIMDQLNRRWFETR
ncbi:MAG TPA: transporter substrate-binding domain-containing protein [Nevskiaceae bacterium]|nr:transporter substrate-binding domain-containing protein [Nevskiaceae bacterium]